MKRCVGWMLLLCLLFGLTALAEDAPQFVGADGQVIAGEALDFPRRQTYAVYTGPGDAYLRAQKGKAEVESGEDIVVYGTETTEDGGSYALIEYPLSGRVSRFGYIEANMVPELDLVAALPWEQLPAKLMEACALTDDPLGKAAELLPLAEGQAVTYLARIDDAWAYVECTPEAEGEEAAVPVRGFVPFACVTLVAEN